MLMQSFGVTNKEHYGMLWHFLEWSIERKTCSRGTNFPLRFGVNVTLNLPRREKLVRHVVMVAKFLDENKPKTSLIT